MSFIPDAEGENIGREANQVVDNFALHETIRAENRLHLCGGSCPQCGHIKEDAEDRLNWADRAKRWALSLTVRKPATQYDADSYPISKPNRNKKKGKRP